MNEQIFNSSVDKCRCCLAEIDRNELRSLFKCGKICGQITKLADMLRYTTSLEIFENDDLPGHICNKCVVHVSKAYAFKQQCIKSDEELRKEQLNAEQLNEEQLNAEQIQYEDVVLIKTDEPVEETAEGVEGYTYHLVEEYEDEERIDEDEEDNGYEKDKIQILLEHQDQSAAQIPVTEESLNVDDEVVVQEEVYEYEVKNEDAVDGSDGATQGSEEEFDIIPKMVFRKYNKRNNKMPAPPYTCNVCSKVLSNYSSFKYHMQLHSDKKPFLCSDCGESFKTRNSYDGHIITHNASAMHKCNICEKSYRQAASLRCHMLSHSGEKPYQCPKCGKGMTQKSGYKKHMLVHSGEKPHHCDVCNKDFRYSSNLIIHRRSHFGERKHKCEICEKKFVGPEQLKRHLLIHTGEKKFCCDICKKCFNRKSSLQVHQNTHAQDRKPKPTTTTTANDSQQLELIFRT